MSRVLLLVPILAGVSATAAAELPDPPPCTSCFIGTLRLSPDPSDPAVKILDEDLYYVASDKFVWKAGKGDKTDGASIPPLFQPIVGGPWEADYLPAAVMHDHYCDKPHRVRAWRATDRMFYEAMIVNHTDVIKAKTMYYAVYAFGPHWGKLKTGVRCGKNCMFSPETGDTFRPADYGSVHEAELKSVEAHIRAKEVVGEPLSLNELDNLAEAAYPADPFLHDSTKNSGSGSTARSKKPPKKNHNWDGGKQSKTD